MPKKKRRSKKSKSKTSKPFAVTKIPKGNAKGLKAGVALVYGSASKPRFGNKRFKTIKTANVYAKKKGLL